MRSNSAEQAATDTAGGLASALLRRVRRVVIGVVGGTVLAIGIAMIVLPGPAFVVIPIGLGILAAEFAWAARLLKRVKAVAGKPDGDRRSG